MVTKKQKALAKLQRRAARGSGFSNYARRKLARMVGDWWCPRCMVDHAKGSLKAPPKEKGAKQAGRPNCPTCDRKVVLA